MDTELRLSIRTVCCKLVVDETTATLLRTTAAAFNAAASFCAQVAWDERLSNKTTLHHRVYGETRATFGLGAQLACCARDKAMEAVKAARANGSDTCPAFKPSSSIRYDARTFTLKADDRVSLNTLEGRVHGTLELGAFQRAALEDDRWEIGGAELVQRGGVWYLCLTQSTPSPQPDEPIGWIGVDLGIVNIATLSDGDTLPGMDAKVRKVRQRRFTHRQALQQANTRRSRWRLRQLSKKEHRFQNDVNHCISKALVTKASRERKALRLEDLTHIRQRTEKTVRRAQRREHSAWAFRQLRTFITYKAQAAGVLVELVDPRNTSRTCSVCGFCDKANRVSQALFSCLNCGFAAPADRNAAINIARGVSQAPHRAAPSSDG